MIETPFWLGAIATNRSQFEEGRAEDAVAIDIEDVRVVHTQFGDK